MKDLGLVLCIGIFAAWAGVASGQAAVLADNPADIPGINDGTSLESVKNQISANLDDWANERAQVSPLKSVACRDAAVENLIYGKTLEPSPLARVRAVRDFLNQSFEGVMLTADEQDRLGVIRAEALSSDSDRLQNQIDLERLAMEVANRNYSAAIQDSMLRAQATEAARGKLAGADLRCSEYSLRVQRDQDLASASQHLLFLYTELDQANTDAIDAIVQSQLGGGGDASSGGQSNH